MMKSKSKKQKTKPVQDGRKRAILFVEALMALYEKYGVVSVEGSDESGFKVEFAESGS